MLFSVFMGREPGLMFFDPEAVKQITVKDFNSFTDRRVHMQILVIAIKY
jgi:hypothetical protein